MGLFERYLTVWVFLCIIAGIIIGHLIPEPIHYIGDIKVAEINIPVAILIWLMIIPMLLKINFNTLHRVKEHWKGIGVTLFVNWAIKPFSMALFGWIFIRILFLDYLPEEQIDSYFAGLILLAAAPCTAMVFVWSYLCKGDPYFTLSQVALNDTIMIFAFAPIVGLLLGIASITIPWKTLFLSVIIYIVIPVVFSQVLRYFLLRKGDESRLNSFLKLFHPISLIALLATLVLIFCFQGKYIIDKPVIILILSVPIILQVSLNSSIAYLFSRKLRIAHSVAGPSALIGASNFFELAVATAISLFGFESGASLATVVGVLIEVPIMLLVVSIVNKSKKWYELNISPN